MSEVVVGPEYGTEYEGTYKVKILTWKEGRELIRKALKSKDMTQYVEDLIKASVTGPADLNKLDDLPTGLVRRLMDEALRLNDISRAESTFLSS